MIISQDPRLLLELSCPKMWTCAVLLSLSEQGTVQECPPPLKLKLVGNNILWNVTSIWMILFSSVCVECPTDSSTDSSDTTPTTSAERDTTSLVVTVGAQQADITTIGNRFSNQLLYKPLILLLSIFSCYICCWSCCCSCSDTGSMHAPYGLEAKKK